MKKMVTIKGHPRVTFPAMQFTGDNFDEINGFGGVLVNYGYGYEEDEAIAYPNEYPGVKLTPGMWVIQVPYTEYDGTENVIGLPYSEELFNELWEVH